MTCDKCNHIVDREDVPHVVRTCQNCGRVMHVHEPGEHGLGFKINKGDQVVIPSKWLRISPNPLQGNGHFTRAGLQWFAEQVFLGQIIRERERFRDELDTIAESYDQWLQASPLLSDLDLNEENDARKAIDLLNERRDTQEWWALLSHLFLDVIKEAISDNDSIKAAWASACMERCRSMLLYKQNYEEVIWMGQSAKRLVDVLNLWSIHRNNSDEEFWQITLAENSYVLAQVFSIPVVLIKDKAYVGGMNIEHKNAKFVDYLFASETSREAVLIEIKTPTAKLIGSRYRKTFYPHADLTGAVMQALEYRIQLMHGIDYVPKGSADYSAFAPRCLLIIGNGNADLDTSEKRKAFELFRSSLKDVEIITYDELFRKIEALAALFNLVRKPS